MTFLHTSENDLSRPEASRLCSAITLHEPVISPDNSVSSPVHELTYTQMPVNFDRVATMFCWIFMSL